jgi:lipoprotein-anchoring transpeptidase ErfK/SrfK
VVEDWYVSADVVGLVKDAGSMEYPGKSATGTKKIIVDRSEQQLYAYDNQVLFMQATTSTGLELTPTPRGNFFIFRKTPTRYMQGPLPYLKDQQYYDLPGVPWTLYFTEGGAAIHGTYWHKGFGAQQSHGCVNLPPDIAKTLYQWATLGTSVVVRD